jgi:hypothetical protein
LALVLVGWIAIRAALWEPPFAPPGRIGGPVPVKTRLTKPKARTQTAAARAALAEAVTALEPPAPLRHAGPAATPRVPRAVDRRGKSPPVTLALLVPDKPLAPLAAARAVPSLPALSSLGPVPATPGPPPPALLATNPAPRRWSGDAWVLVRRGSGGLAAASGFPSYGASQAGGVLRFSLAPGSAHAPQAYVRLSRALGGFDEGEIAGGLSARPIPALPLRLLGEARAQRASRSTRVRPVASLVTELPQVRLPLGAVGEAYAQAGYAGPALGGKRGATMFFDLQTVADRRLTGADRAELRLGGGVWSGGQKGAARLDLGPRASVRFAAGPARARLALDWRVRVAGNARPGSGPTLTFSAGF